MTEQERLEEMVKEKVEQMNNIGKKETIFDKTKQIIVSDYAKKVYGVIIMGVVQGAVARFTFDTLGKLEDSTIIKIED